MQDLQQHNPDRYGQPSLAAMLAQQRQGDVARAAEQHRVVAVARAGSLDNSKTTRVARARALDALQTRLAAARPAIGRALHRAVVSQTSTAAACCA